MSNPYVRPMPRTWYLRTQPFRMFMIRELTSFFLAGYLVFLLVILARLGEGPEQYAALRETLRSPLSLVGHGLAFCAALYHSITWFNLTPKAMAVRVGEERLPAPLVAIALGYLPWLVGSGLILWGVLR